MDQNTMILVFNLLLNLIVVIDHGLQRMKKSKCFLGEIEMQEQDNKDNKKNNDNLIIKDAVAVNINDDILNVNKNDVNKNIIKNLNNINKNDNDNDILNRC